MTKQKALDMLQKAVKAATDTGLWDDLAADVHPDKINNVVDAILDFTIEENQK